MAVFGVPNVREDDASRALQAALEMRERLVELNQQLARDHNVTLEIRTGVNTGEVVAPMGDAPTQTDRRRRRRERGSATRAGGGAGHHPGRRADSRGDLHRLRVRGTDAGHLERKAAAAARVPVDPCPARVDPGHPGAAGAPDRPRRGAGDAAGRHGRGGGGAIAAARAGLRAGGHRQEPPIGRVRGRGAGAQSRAAVPAWSLPRRGRGDHVLGTGRDPARGVWHRARRPGRDGCGPHAGRRGDHAGAAWRGCVGGCSDDPGSGGNGGRQAGRRWRADPCR